MSRAKKKMKKEVNQAEAAAPAAAAGGINSLSPDLLERILSLFSLKPRTRLKCVSTTWHTAITNLRPRAQSSSSGLVIFSLEMKFTPRLLKFYHVTIFAAHDDGTCKKVKSFTIGDVESYTVEADFPKQLYPILADAHNGLLLLRDAYRPRVYLCNPLLSDPAGLAELPWLYLSNALLPDPAGLAGLLFLHCPSNSQCGFFFDPASSSENQQWKIVNFTVNSASYDDRIICCHVYSPESNQWEEVEATLLEPPGGFRKFMLLMFVMIENYIDYSEHI